MACNANAKQMLANYTLVARATVISYEYEPPLWAEFRCRVRTTLERISRLACDDGEIAGQPAPGAGWIPMYVTADRLHPSLKPSPWGRRGSLRVHLQAPGATVVICAGGGHHYCETAQHRAARIHGLATHQRQREGGLQAWPGGRTTASRRLTCGRPPPSRTPPQHGDWPLPHRGGMKRWAPARCVRSCGLISLAVVSPPSAQSFGDGSFGSLI